ncbi:bifunctional adenosylcobinamide kinase/adenosylcobinamide-phosphate guanylyltransferase [Gordonia desulfuricans]|nr:bifunctional adenosylcobinamide kinase/adenosylcobinamide-phosphate guanylyltransferase [Gordonia desulfuricans]
MKVVLLGTGSADGWPNPFCRCESCADAVRHGEIRGQTAALVDDVLMLDIGPDAPGAAVRQGHSLAGVRHVLITHAHSDHLGPQALLTRSWVAGLDALEVYGPADALEMCRPWVGPGDPVRFIPVSAGDRICVGEYEVRVLPARHSVFREGDAVLYDVAGPDGTRMLWATDTGVWPAGWYAAVDGAGFDAVFLEETFGDRGELSAGHLGLAGFAEVLGELRSVGAVDESSDIVAVHLGHHNPGVVELRERLAVLGARPGVDGEVVMVGGGRGGSRTLVVGGARSGKSRYAEHLMRAQPAVTYVATGGGSTDDPGRAGDGEWAERIARHRADRPSWWETIETHDVVGVLRTAEAPIVIDCLGTWLTARLDMHGVWSGGGITPVEADVEELLSAWRDCAVPVVAVTNEVGSGVVPGSASGRLFRDLLGRLNAAMAQESDSVVLMVAGQPLVVRGESPDKPRSDIQPRVKPR